MFLATLFSPRPPFFWPGRENPGQEIEGAAKLPIIRSAGMKAPGQNGVNHERTRIPG